MRDDEFNNLKIVNDENNPNSEFGATPDSESESFKDNSYDIRDEVNDNPTSNDENKSPEEKKREQDEGNNSSSDGSNKSSSHGGGASGIVSGAVVGAALVSIVALSTLVGINLYINAKCEFSTLEANDNTITYAVNLSDTENDTFAITLSNSYLSYKETQDLVEGDNEGVFEGLQAGTEYKLEVVDLSFANYAIYSKTVKTTGGTPEGYVTITFVANNGTDETMDPVVLPVGTEYTLPACEFSDPDLHQMFKGWQINGSYAGQYYSWKVKTDTVLTATWQDAYAVTYTDGYGSDPHIEKVSTNDSLFYTLSEAPWPAPEGKELFKWRNSTDDRESTPGEWMTIDGDMTLVAIWVDINPVIHSIKFTRYFADSGSTGGSLSFTLDYEDPKEKIKNFSLAIKEDASTTVATIAFSPSDTPGELYSLGDATLQVTDKNYLYELTAIPENPDDAYVALTGYFTPRNINSTASMTFTKVYSSVPNYWVSDGKSYLPVNVNCNPTYCDYPYLALQILERTDDGSSATPTLASDYTYVELETRDGPQIAVIPFEIPSPSTMEYNFWELALCGKKYPSAAYQVLEEYSTGSMEVGTQTYGYRSINQLGVAAISSFYFDDGVLPLEEDSATNVKINLDGYSLSEMNGITESYLTFEFYDPSSPITYTLPVTIDPDVLVSDKCAYLDLTAVTNSSSETDFEGFVEAVKTRPCSVSLTVKNNGYNNVSSCYTDHSFL